jgi:putative flippase GtrA
MSSAEGFKPGSLRLTTPARFVLAGGLAAMANFAARFGFSAFMPYGAAIVIAFFVGMTVAFVLNRYCVFSGSTRPIHQQMFWFVTINMLALLQTLLVSLLLARVLLPRAGVSWHAEEIAHAVGIAVPIFTSYIGHKQLTFR